MLSKNVQNQNEIFLNDKGWMEVHYIGDQTSETILKTHEEHKNVSKQHMLGEKPLKYLVDVSKLTKNDSGARKAVVFAIGDLNVEKLAVFGGGIFLKTLTNLIFTAVGKQSIMKYFSSREDAEKWLET